MTPVAKRNTSIGTAAVLAVTAGTLLFLNGNQEIAPTLNIYTTNLNNEITNCVFKSSFGYNLFLVGEHNIISTNSDALPDITHVIVCTNAIVLNWFGITNYCYQIQYKPNFVGQWQETWVWKLGEDKEIQFFLPQYYFESCFFRLVVIPTPSLVMEIPIPPPPLPPPPPPPRMRGFASNTENNNKYN